MSTNQKFLEVVVAHVYEGFGAKVGGGSRARLVPERLATSTEVHTKEVLDHRARLVRLGMVNPSPTLLGR